MDALTTRALSIHLNALLPPTSTELDVAHNIQVAAILSVGLLYQSTAHRHMAEVLLSEIGWRFACHGMGKKLTCLFRCLCI